MTARAFVVDSSVAVKWVISEYDSVEAIAVYESAQTLCAPDIIVAECANVLWKKVRRAQATRETALVAAAALERAKIEIVPSNSLLAISAELAIDLDHPAYDCFYIALARRRGLELVTADERLLRKLAEREDELKGLAISLSDAVSPTRSEKA